MKSITRSMASGEIDNGVSLESSDSIGAESKLAEYEDAEKKGTLVRFQCRTGDTVYYPEAKFDFIFPVKISTITIEEPINGHRGVLYSGAFFQQEEPVQDFEFDEDDFGKDAFLTMEDAQRELGRRKNRENDE